MEEQQQQQQADAPQSWGKQPVTVGVMLVWCGITAAAYWLTLTHLTAQKPGAKEAAR